MNKKLDETDIPDEIYESFDAPTKGKITLIAFALLFFALWLNFPIKSSIENFVAAKISKLRSCPIQYSKMNISFLFPSIEFVSPKIGGRCFGKAGKDVMLDNLEISFSGPSFAPFGVKFHAEAKKQGSTLNLYPAVSFGETVIRVIDTKIEGPLLNEMIGQGALLSGTFDIDALVTLKGQKAKEASFKVISTNFSTLPKNIMGIQLPSLLVGATEIKGSLRAGKKITLDKADFGNENADLVGRFKGSIDLNSYNPSYSKMNIEGLLSPSDKFINAIPLIKVFLKGKNSENGFYRLKLSGQLNKPKPQFL